MSPERRDGVNTGDRYAHVLRAGVVKLFLAPEFGIFLGLLVLVIVFQVLSGQFFSNGEITGATTTASTIGIIGIGVAFLMISGEFDLSVGAVAAFVSIIMAQLITTLSWPPVLALLAALTTGATIGLLNGLFTMWFNIPSFITTLGTYFVMDGINYIITGGFTIDVFGNGAFYSILGGQPRDLPFGAPFFWMLLMGLIGALVLGNMQYGNWTLASGSKGGAAAHAIGVPIRRVKLINFVVCSTLAGFAGCAALAQYGSTSSGFASNYNLLAIVAAVLGGCSLYGGRGSIIGTIIGACVLGVLETGLVLVGAPGTWYTVIIGGILVLAVIVNVRIDAIGNRLAVGIRRGK